MALGTYYQRLEVQRTLFEASGRAFDFCPCLLAAIAWNESRGVVQAVNPDSGTVGLMQIHPVHFQSLGWTRPTAINRTARTGSGGSGWNDAAENIRAGASILRSALNRRGLLTRALQDYVGASTADRARPYTEAVMMTAIKLAGYYYKYQRWSD